MPDSGSKRPSMRTIIEAIGIVSGQVRAMPAGECDDRTRKNALDFLEGLEKTVSSFCRRLTDDNETLDPCPRPKP